MIRNEVYILKINIDINKEYKELTIAVMHHTMTEEVSQVIARLNTEPHKISGKQGDHLYLLHAKDIHCIYTQHQRIYADTMEGSFEIAEKLYQLEEILTSQGFIRISKYALANKEMIDHLSVPFNGHLVMHFKNGKSETVSRRNITKVKAELGIGGKK